MTYWFEKARAQIEACPVRYAGLVATNSIRGGANRKVLERITATGAIFNAWSDEPWINEGAAVRVSLVAFCPSARTRAVWLDGIDVDGIQADLTAGTTATLTSATKLAENTCTCFIGTQQNGPFTIDGTLARTWLRQPAIGARPMSDVVRPWRNGRDLTDRASDTWIIDFGMQMPADQAALLTEPYEHVVAHVRPMRLAGQRESRKRYWWRLGEPAPALRHALNGLPRFIAGPRVAKHRVWTYLDITVLPDVQVITVARSDDTTFGILHSRFHELWSLRMGTSLEDRPRYTPTTTFETFPFPEGLTPADTGGPVEALDDGVILPNVALRRRPAALAIARAAHRLNFLRENWLNPAEWVERLPEIVPGYPDRIIPKPEHAVEIKKRTLTNLYNARPAWLDNAHQALDAAVAIAYGWDDYTPALPDAEILRRLLDLNLARSSGQ